MGNLSFERGDSIVEVSSLSPSLPEILAWIPGSMQVLQLPLA